MNIAGIVAGAAIGVTAGVFADRELGHIQTNAYDTSVREHAANPANQRALTEANGWVNDVAQRFDAAAYTRDVDGGGRRAVVPDPDGKVQAYLTQHQPPKGTVYIDASPGSVTLTSSMPARTPVSPGYGLGLLGTMAAGGAAAGALHFASRPGFAGVAAVTTGAALIALAATTFFGSMVTLGPDVPNV